MPGVSALEENKNSMPIAPNIDRLRSVYVIYFVSLLFLFGLTAIRLWRVDYEWHDQQRIVQLLILCLALASFIFQRRSPLPSTATTGILLILSLGLISSLYSHMPGWALLEWAHWIGLITLFIATANSGAKNIWRPMLLIICGINALQVAEFFLMYAMSFITGIREIDIKILVSGFTNMRFYGQFQALTLPLLAFTSLYLLKNKKKSAYLIFFILSTQWCIAIAQGGRGVFLALFCSHFLLVFIAKKHWGLIQIQAFCAILGAGIFFLLFNFIPTLLGIESTSHELIRTTLSRREDLWLLALQLAKNHPWLGAGPMHYSVDTLTSSAYHAGSHPHQAILLWLAEWGTPATLIACSLIAWGLLVGIKRIRSQDSSALDAGLWLSLTSTWILAQVDGVFVMPYTQTWLAVIAGLAAARWCQFSTPTPALRLLANGFAIAALAILAPVLIKEVPAFIDKSQPPAEHHIGVGQRFWMKGLIREKDGDHRLWPFKTRNTPQSSESFATAG